MFYSSLKGVKAFSISFSSRFFGFQLIIRFGVGALEVESAASSSLNVLGVIILGISVF